LTLTGPFSDSAWPVRPVCRCVVYMDRLQPLVPLDVRLRHCYHAQCYQPGLRRTDV